MRIMRAITWIALLMVVAAGCSGQNPASVRDESRAEIMPEEVVVIAQETGDLGDESLWIVCSIEAQLLQNKYERYRGARLGEADFSRMPDNQLTRNLERLYLDVRAALE